MGYLVIAVEFIVFLLNIDIVRYQKQGNCTTYDLDNFERWYDRYVLIYVFCSLDCRNIVYVVSFVGYVFIL